MSEERRTVHLKDGGKVLIDGDRCEVHLGQPFVVHRKHWIRGFLPEEEVRRTLLGVSNPYEAALAEAFRAVPMTVYPEDDA